MISAVTENISSDGFYCVSQHSFVPGEILEVELSLPTHNPDCLEERARVICQAQIVRLDSTWLGPGYGIGCRFETYTLRMENEKS